jgi:PleD family two-component response regulator
MLSTVIILKNRKAKAELGGIFKAMGYTVVSARSAKQMLEEIKKGHITTSCIEIQLKNPNGLKLARQMRKIKSAADLSIIMVDTKPSDANYRSSKKVDGLYIIHPSDKTFIMRTIMRAIVKPEQPVIYGKVQLFATPEETQYRGSTIRDLNVSKRRLANTGPKNIRDVITAKRKGTRS